MPLILRVRNLRAVMDKEGKMHCPQNLTPVPPHPFPSARPLHLGKAHLFSEKYILPGRGVVQALWPREGRAGEGQWAWRGGKTWSHTEKYSFPWAMHNSYNILVKPNLCDVCNLSFNLLIWGPPPAVLIPSSVLKHHSFWGSGNLNWCEKLNLGQQCVRQAPCLLFSL